MKRLQLNDLSRCNNLIGNSCLIAGWNLLNLVDKRRLNELLTIQIVVEILFNNRKMRRKSNYRYIISLYWYRNWTANILRPNLPINGVTSVLYTNILLSQIHQTN